MLDLGYPPEVVLRGADLLDNAGDGGFRETLPG